MKLIALLMTVSSLLAQAQTITYGDLMVEEQTKDWKLYRLGLIGGYDVTNPYLNTYSFGLKGWTDLNRHFSWGSESLFYSVSKSRYNSNLEKDLRTFGVEAAHDKPCYQISVLFAGHALQGRANLFGRKAVPFRFDLRAGPTWLMIDRGQPELTDFGAVTWGLGPTVQIGKGFVAELGFDQDIQQPLAGRNAVYRNRLSLALLYAYDR